MPDLDALIAGAEWGWCLGKKRHVLGRVVQFAAGQSYTAKCRSIAYPLWLDPEVETPKQADCCRHCLRLLKKEAADA